MCHRGCARVITKEPLIRPKCGQSFTLNCILRVLCLFKVAQKALKVPLRKWENNLTVTRIYTQGLLWWCNGWVRRPVQGDTVQATEECVTTAEPEPWGPRAAAAEPAVEPALSRRGAIATKLHPAMKSSRCSLQLEQASHSNRTSALPKISNILKIMLKQEYIQMWNREMGDLETVMVLTSGSWECRHYQQE